ncbi:MAG TPA: AI-2E family transporter [Candidatus Anaerobiospirillum pullistercoris]|uniref:AI-2E family transporter n=1 Tax=Candidatus Anaerobiospirillum pullistercoris TaxID=2838452 RepID=A0A9D1WC14_9GAMM|nr:AI-2E family transporter [Candidatus Anaerobiospirillum pullistercoris]
MITLLRRWYLRHFSQPGTIEFALVLLCAFIIVYYFMWLVGPLVVALCLAFCLDWPVEALSRALKIKRQISSILVMIAFCSCVIFITVLIVPNVIKQGAEFYNSIVAFSLENSNGQKAAAPTKNPSTSATQNEDTEIDATSGAADNSTPRSYPDDYISSIQSGYRSTGLSTVAHSTVATGTNMYIAKVTARQEAAAQAAAEAVQAAAAEAAAKAATAQAQAQTAAQAQATASTEVVPAPAVGEGVQVNAGQFIGDPRTFTHDLKLPLDTNGISLNPSGGDGTFTLTVSDFDLRIANEIYDIVVNLPEPIPSMVTLKMLERSVQNGRIAATNKIADLMRTQLMPSVFNAFTWLVYFIIVPIFTFLMLYDKQSLQRRAATFLLPNNQKLMKEFWPSLHGQIAGYIRGKILHIIIISCANTVAFMLMGVNYAMLLGVGVGLSVVIPYVGAVIIAVPVVLVAIFQFGFSSSLMWVLVIYTVIQLLDSNVLTPMLFSKAMNLDAFSILAAILIFGNLWGFWGVFFAIPLATFIKTLIVRWPNTDLRQAKVKQRLALRKAAKQQAKESEEKASSDSTTKGKSQRAEEEDEEELASANTKAPQADAEFSAHTRRGRKKV